MLSVSDKLYASFVTEGTLLKKHETSSSELEVDFIIIIQDIIGI